MSLPYHTGKVAIGSTYAPTQRPYHDRDAIKLQDALLGNRPHTDASGICIAIVCALLVAIPLIHYWTRT